MRSPAADIAAAADRITAQVRAIVPHHAAIAAVTAAYRSVAPAVLVMAKQRPMQAGLLAVERATAGARAAAGIGEEIAARINRREGSPHEH